MRKVKIDRLGRVIIPIQALEPETKETLTRMVVQPSNTRLQKYDRFIKDLKISQGLQLGILNLNTLFDAIYMRAGHTEQASLLNWVSTSYDSVNNLCTFTTDYGFQSTSSSSYVDTTLVPNTSTHMSGSDNGRYYFTHYLTTGGGWQGTGTNYIATVARNDSGFRITCRFNSATDREGNIKSPVWGGGFFLQTNTGQFIYNNGILDYSNSTTTSGALPSTTMYEHRRSAGPTVLNSDVVNGITMYGKGSIINPLTVYTAMRNYLVSIGITGI